MKGEPLVRVDIPQSTLDQLNLRIRAREEQNGWGISGRIRKGSLYLAFHSLERRGFRRSGDNLPTMDQVSSEL